jgi:hypothetical protein
VRRTVETTIDTLVSIGMTRDVALRLLLTQCALALDDAAFVRRLSEDRIINQ